MAENKTRGFVTVATGSDEYYRLAENLRISYKKRGKGRFPFALICDRENEYTALFDQVILAQEVRRSTLDKLLMRLSPYDETIFLDADTLVIGDIDDLWDVFRDQDDVSAFGCTLPLDSQKGWFTYGGSGAYQDRVKYLISMNGGIYYVRKSALSQKVFQDAQQVVKDYATIDFKYFSLPQDEPVMAMAMVINGCKPADIVYDMIVLPFAKEKISVDYQGNVYEGRVRTHKKLIHFATAKTRLFLYHYLIDVIRSESYAENRRHYLLTRIRYAPRDIKATVFHTGGVILRGWGLDKVVEFLKNIKR